MNSKSTAQFCDHCGEIIPMGDACVIQHLPIDITSENTGGSAVVCQNCYVLITTGSVSQEAVEKAAKAAPEFAAAWVEEVE